MKQGTVQIVGIKKSEKNSKVSWSIYGITPFEPWEEENAVGCKVVTEWTNRVDCSGLKPGDTVELSYTKGFQNTAVLNNITVIEKAK